MAQDDTLTVTRNDADDRYEIHVGDTLGGFTHWIKDGDERLIFDHTKIDPAFKGRGLGSELVRQALEDVAARGETVIAECPFVARFLGENEVSGLKVDRPHSGDADG